MKKRILSILLILCMVLALCPVTAFADENYMITQNFKYGTRTYDGTDPQTSPYQFVIPAGGSFGLATIEDCSPYELVGWKETGSGTVYPPYGEIENLSSDLTFDAVYQVQGGLTITVDGFMPGNTPNDCTVTMESTIPGITFSEDDIQYIRWDKYAADGDRYPVTNNDAFQAGTRYKCFIDLDSNGLTEVPVVTVNGNTPDYCTLPYFAGVPEKLSIGCDLGTPTEPGSLAITVDGFEVGKTPADCTFSFESTIPGIEFSAADIAEIFWEFFDGQWYHNLQDTDTFDADKTYSCYIRLSPKGLTSAPAATVNGNTPFYCDIEGLGPQWLCVYCNMGEPAPTITIDGPDVVCAQQEYEFTITAPEGVTLNKQFGFDTGGKSSGVDLTIDENGVGHGVMLTEWYDLNTNYFDLIVYGYTADQPFVSATKRVQVSQDHVYVDGVCSCGAVQQYTITYDPGEGKGSIADGIKTHGDNFTLSRDTFTRAGYEQTGWATSDGGEKVYDLGGTYTENKDITLYPVWSDIENPKIIGIEDGKTYCSAQTVTVSDNDAIKEVTVNGTAVNFDANNQFILPANGEQTIVAMDKAGNKKTVTVTVNNGHTAGNDDGNCSTPVYCIYHPDTVVVAAKSHDFSGEWQKNGTDHWHICQNDGCAISETETPHSCTDDGDCTTAVICECGYVITAANAEHSYGECQSNGDGTHTRYCTVDGCSGYEDGDCEGGQASYFKKAVCDECNEAYGELLTDKTAPTGEISIGTNKWNSFLNTITFGLFFKDTQSVTVTAADDSYNHDGYTDDKAVKVAYYLHSGDTVLTKEDLASKEFTIYDGGFNINPDNKYVVYARLTDHAGNVTYISSNGIVLDSVVPVISGIENGKTYCEEQTVTVTEEYIESVKVNGTAVTLDANNQFILNPAEGTQTIVVTDKAGNETSVTVTVNDGHTAGNDDGDCSTPVYCIYHPDTVVVAAKSHDFSGEWQKNGTDHWHICQNDGCAISETETPHSCTDDGDCTTAVICECGYVITAANAKHTYGEWQSNSDDTHTRYCTVEGCNGYEDGNCAGGEATCVAKAVCDTCKAEYGEIDSANHNLEKIPAKDATVTETGNTEYWHCQDCGKYFADENGTKEIKLEDTIIPKLSPEIIEGKGQSITAGEKKELIFKSNAAFSDFIRVELDGKTLDEKNYTVKEGSTVVTLKADYVATLSVGEHTIGIVSASGTATTTFIVNAKAVVDNDTKSPQTGDNRHMALWIALLFVSGAGVIGTTVYGKKKRAK